VLRPRILHGLVTAETRGTAVESLGQGPADGLNLRTKRESGMKRGREGRMGFSGLLRPRTRSRGGDVLGRLRVQVLRLSGAQSSFVRQFADCEGSTAVVLCGSKCSPSLCPISHVNRS
jgi:hypothetical protein